MLDLAGADAEGQRAERTVRCGVRVAADDRHAGLRDAELRSDDVDDALAAVAEAGVGDTELGRVAIERLELQTREVILDPGDAELDARRRRVVVGGRERPIGPADPAPGEAEPLERLRARHLVREMQIDVQQVVADDVIGPDLLEAGHSHGCSLIPFQIRG